MVRLYIARAPKESEHETGIKLAEHAFFDAFGKTCRLSHTENGKPFYEGKENAFVSISHADGLCIAALSDSEIGADTECMIGDTDRLKRLARRYFTPAEADYVCESPQTRFFEIWCKKESYMKYAGKGFSLPMNSFSVYELPLWFSCLIHENHMICICSRETLDTKPIFTPL